MAKSALRNSVHLLNVFPIAFYITLYVVYDIVIAKSNGNKGEGSNAKYQYNTITVVTLTEFGKFAISLVLFLIERRLYGWHPIVTFTAGEFGNLGLTLRTTAVKSARREGDTGVQQLQTTLLERDNTALNESAVEVKGELRVGDVLVSIDGEDVTALPWVHAVENRLQDIRILAGKTTAEAGGAGLELDGAIVLEFARPIDRHTIHMTAWLGVPALLYTFWNILNFQSLLHVDLSQYSIWYQCNILITAIVWAIVFRKRYTFWQVMSFVLVIACCVMVRIKDDDSGIRLTFSWAIFYVILQATISALAGVLNEFAYKMKELAHLSLNLQNTILYFYGTVFSAVVGISWWCANKHDPNFPGFFDPLSLEAHIIVVLGVFIGLVVSYILRHLNNIVKVFAAAAHVPCEIVIAHYVLGTPMTKWVAIASVGILASIVLYRLFPHASQSRRSAVSYANAKKNELADVEEELIAHTFTM